jgi:hypothetical protein
MRSTCLSKASSTPSVVWVERFRLVVRNHLAVFGRGGAHPCEVHDLPQASVPLQSLTRDPWRRFWPTPALSRGFSPPRRYRPAEIHHSRAFPARVTLRPRTYHVPRRLSPSAGSLVSFQPGAPTGQTLQSFSRQRYAPPFSSASPLAIGDRPLQQTQGLLFRTSRDWPPKGLVPRTDHRRPVPLVSAVLLALSAHRHFCQSGLASGVCSLCRLGPPPPDFSTRGTPCSLGFHPPWGTPLLRLDLDGCRDSFSRSTTPPHSQDRSCEHAWSPLGTSGHPRSEMCSLCSRVSKSCGRWRCLFRGCRPLEVCVLIPAVPSRGAD